MNGKRRIVSLLLLLVVVSAPRAQWSLVTGEQSVIATMQEDISRDNLYCMFRFDTRSGEVHLLQSTYGKKTVEDTWVQIRSADSVQGRWEMAVGEYSLLRRVVAGDIERENLYGGLLLEKASGKLYRLMLQKSKNGFTSSWHEIAGMPVGGTGEWCMRITEHSVVSYDGRDFDRENIYSVFLSNTLTGNVFRLQSWYRPDGTIGDTWVGQ